MVRRDTPNLNLMRLLVFGFRLFAYGPLAAQTALDAPAGLILKGAIDLSNVDGRMDHFSADVKNRRVFVSALGDRTLEILDGRAGKRVRPSGFRTRRNRKRRLLMRARAMLRNPDAVSMAVCA